MIRQANGLLIGAFILSLITYLGIYRVTFNLNVNIYKTWTGNVQRLFNIDSRIQESNSNDTKGDLKTKLQFARPTPIYHREEDGEDGSILQIIYPSTINDIPYVNCSASPVAEVLMSTISATASDMSPLPCAFISQQSRNISQASGTPLCECPPKTLVGQFGGKFVIYKAEHLQSVYPDIKEGGEWRPEVCVAREKVAILVPFKNRSHHLPIILNALHPFLRRQQIHYRIYIVEQANGKVFNKGSTLNAGFDAIMKLWQFDCVILHDIDVLPENDWNFYSCGQYKLVHLASRMDRVAYAWRPDVYTVGGVLAITPENYRKVNGYSNKYQGWGGEDDDFRIRLQTAELWLLNANASAGCFTTIKHERDETFPENNLRYSLVRHAAKLRHDYNLLSEGLSTVRYIRDHVHKASLYTKISISFTKEHFADAEKVYEEYGVKAKDQSGI